MATLHIGSVGMPCLGRRELCGESKLKDSYNNPSVQNTLLNEAFPASVNKGVHFNSGEIGKFEKHFSELPHK